jgi:23S rRNA pseudouridine2605 synthase
MHRCRHPQPPSAADPKTGLARALSKLGFCSRRQAWDLIQAGRVRVNHRVLRDPESRVAPGRDRIEVDGQEVRAGAKVYLMLNKPRGLVTTASDEQGRETVFTCLAGRELPFVAPVGRLDRASEGLLLFTNDTAWAAHLTDPESHLDKTYHVQVDCLADADLTRRLATGVTVEGEFLSAKRVAVLRRGQKNSWLEIVLDEGRNRQIRRLLEAFGVGVLRLVRVAIGPLQLGGLAKGQCRFLAAGEVDLPGMPRTRP